MQWHSAYTHAERTHRHDPTSSHCPYALSTVIVVYACVMCLRRLEELCVTGISNRTVASEQVAPVCSWHTLRYTSNQDYMDAEAWQWLPVPAKGKLHIHAACQPQGTWYKFDEEPRSVDLALPITDLVSVNSTQAKGLR